MHNFQVLRNINSRENNYPQSFFFFWLSLLKLNQIFATASHIYAALSSKGLRFPDQTYSGALAQILSLLNIIPLQKRIFINNKLAYL